jgi:hypothetical protein
MKKTPKLLLALLALSLLITSCGHPKQYSSCGDIPKSLNGTFYDNLVKEWGEPIKKEERGMTFYVTWSGVGVNGVDKEMMFKLDYLTGTTVAEPFQFEGVTCDN